MIREFLWLFLLFINILCINKYGYYLGIAYFFLLITEILREFGVFLEVKFHNKTMDRSTLFYYDYVGDYSKVNTLIQKVCEIKKEKNLTSDLYKLVGIYYDNPKKSNIVKRAIIGLITNRNDLEEFFTNKGLKRIDLPKSEFVFSSLPYLNILSLFVFLWKIYPKLDLIQQNLQIFKINLEFPCIIELYENDKIEILIPLENIESFRQPILIKAN